MKVGFAVNDITPELGIYLTGYGRPERLADGVHSPLLVHAMFMSEGGVECAVVSLDWCFIGEALVDPVRAAISGATGIKKENILLCCTHTHSAPHTCAKRTLGRTDVDPEGRGMRYALDKTPIIADAVRQAQLNARECAAGFRTVKTETGISRRGADETGAVRRFIGDPYQIYDSNLTAVHFVSADDGADLGILIHASCHNTAMGYDDHRISSDWCGVMRERVRERYHVPVMFLNGSFGDVGPRMNRYVEYGNTHGYSAGPGDGERAVLEVGGRAATDALRALEDIRDFRRDLPLKVRTETIRLPQAISLSEAEAKRRVAEFEKANGPDAAPDAECQVARSVLEAYTQLPRPIREFDQTVISFGPAALAPFPFEMFSIFSLRLRKFGPFEYMLLCSNVNGHCAYMPDRGSIAVGGYEVNCRERFDPYVTLPEAGDLAVVATLASLRKLAEQ